MVRGCAARIVYGRGLAIAGLVLVGQAACKRLVSIGQSRDDTNI